MESDAYIRKVIEKTPSSKLDFLIGEYIHDERNQDIARRKILKNEKHERIAEVYDLTPKQIRNIIKKARRTIFEHL